jgi:hypothetical protein
MFKTAGFCGHLKILILSTGPRKGYAILLAFSQKRYGSIVNIYGLTAVAF